MIAKLMKFLSGVAAAMAGRKPQPHDHDISNLQDNKLVALEARCSDLRDSNTVLIRERRELRKRLQRAESMSDAKRGHGHAAELDRVKAILLDRHGLSVSRVQIASAVQDLSDRLTASHAVLQKLDRVVDVAGLTG